MKIYSKIDTEETYDSPDGIRYLVTGTKEEIQSVVNNTLGIEVFANPRTPTMCIIFVKSLEDEVIVALHYGEYFV